MASPHARPRGRFVGALAFIVTCTLPLPAQSASPISNNSTRVTLRDVLDSVRLRSPLLGAARARATAVRGDRMVAGTLQNPMVSYQLENARLPGSTAVVGMPTEHMTMASVPLSPLYQRGARVSEANASVRAADAELRLMTQQVSFDAARAFYRVSIAEIGVEVAENLAIWLDSVATYNRNRVEQGVTAEADLIRTELERDRAIAEAGMQAAELARARADLAVFLGDPRTIVAAWSVAQDERPLALPPDPTTGANSRPAVVAARERLSAASSATSFEQRMRISDVAGMIGIKQSMGMNSAMAGFSLPLPLFDQNRGGVARARALRDAAQFDLVAQERVAVAEVSGAFEAARILTARATALAAPDSSGRASRYLQRAELARTIALGAYREGAVQLLQVIDAARAWGDARMAYFRTIYAQHEAVLALLTARGDDLAAVLPTLTSER